MEVTGMSYSNGLGSLQPGFNTVDVSGASKASAAAKTDASVAAKTDASVSANAASGTDQASLSSMGGIMAQALSNDSDVRTDKVAALQQQIAAGTYNVPAGNVADKLMNALLS
jgi:flagellar biosynthesis anti-sigma factor FlgM